MQQKQQRSFSLYVCILVCAFYILSPFAGHAKVASKQHSLVGKASWYGGKFHGRLTASGTVYDMHMSTAAHKTLPFGTVVEVIAADNSAKTVVCITDRGPYIRGRVIDLSRAAANELGVGSRGVVPVKLRVVTDMHGITINADEAFFVQIQNKHSKKYENIGPYNQFADATVMRDVLMGAHPDASIVVDKINANS